eukprot:1883420-Alexandrium_andersonii.AAC.1
MDKQARARAATLALLRRGTASSRDLEVIIGRWVWMLLPLRLGLAVLATVYEFIQAAHPSPRPLLRSVVAELRALLALQPFLACELDLGWHGWAYMVDASLEGYGAVATRSCAAELRAEARWCERRGW